MGIDMMQQPSLVSEIITLIEQRAGLVLREAHREQDALRAIALTVAEFGLRDSEMLFYRLQQHDSMHPVWQKLLQLLTIGETYFFRNQAHFEALREDILPQMIARKRENNHRWLRIWSAGCSTGEEIYSLAIMIRELLPDYKDWSIYLIGTDINEAYLELARMGVYRINSFRSETPAALREQWFTQHGSVYKLDASIRNMVIFRNVNLVTDSYPTRDTTLESMDMILCQNVTIYFERPITERIQASLVDTLAEDGWLILGHSEPLYIKSPYLGLRNFPNAVVYQRQQPMPVAPKQVISPKPPKKPHPKAATLMGSKRTTAPLPPLQQKQETDKADALCQQAREAADRQQWREALALLDTLLQSHPLYEYAHYLRALIYMEQMEFTKSLASLRQALYCNSNFILAHYTLGELYSRMGYPTQAKREWQLTRSLLSHLEPESFVPHSTDLTVVMLIGLISMQLSNGGLKSS
jgi:chemotaxis protein methyltransferase CheR